MLKTGCRVWVSRGGGRTTGPGRGRLVLARYLGQYEGLAYCRLLQDDPDATDGISLRGQVGHWSPSALTPVKKEVARG